MGLVRVLAKYVVNEEFEKLPFGVIEHTKKLLLDCTGTLIIGRYTDEGEKAAQYASSTNANPDATIPGCGKIHREMAAFANAFMIRVSDLDDGHRAAMGHPAGVITAAALAASEYVNASGPETLTAIVAGYEVYARVGMTINPSAYIERGFDATGICGAIGAAAAAKLYKMDEEHTMNALGIAGLHAGSLNEYVTDGSMGKSLSPAWGAANGVKSAELAKLGITGPETILEGKKGFFQAFAKVYDINGFGSDLGTNYEILRNYFKMHACVRRLHSSIDSVLTFRAEHALTPDRVKQILIRAGKFVNEANKPHPKTLVGAQTSLPFCIAVALKHGFIDHKSLHDSLQDDEIAAIEDKVKIVYDQKVLDHEAANPSHWGAADVELVTTSGQTMHRWAPLALGEPETPVSWEQLVAKYERLVSVTKFYPLAQKLSKMIQHFETCKSVGEFTAILNAAG